MFEIVVSGLLVVVLAAVLYSTRNQSPKKSAGSGGKVMKTFLTVAIVVAALGLLGSILRQTVSRQGGFSHVAQLERSPKFAAIKAHFPDEYQTLVTPLLIARTPEAQRAALERANSAAEQLVIRQLRFVDGAGAARYLDLESRRGLMLERGDAQTCRTYFVGDRPFDGVAAFGPEAIMERERLLGDIVVQTATRPASTATLPAMEQVSQRINDLAAKELTPEQLAQLDGFFNTGIAPSDDAGATALCRYMSRRVGWATQLPLHDKQAFLQGAVILE